MQKGKFRRPSSAPEARKERSCQYYSASHIKRRAERSFHRPTFIRPGLSCHELLHALGVQHEHQRRDRDLSLYVHDVKGEWKPQYCSIDDLIGLTRLDPLSIIMYPEKRNQLWRNRRDSVWFAKPTTEVNRKMSELDKVGLNNLYRPCKGANYSPKRFGIGITGLWYCGR